MSKQLKIRFHWRTVRSWLGRFLLTVADQGRFQYLSDPATAFALDDTKAVEEAHAFEKEFDLRDDWPLEVRVTVESGENEAALGWEADGADATKLAELVRLALRRGKKRGAGGASRPKSPKSPRAQAKMFTPPAKKTRPLAKPPGDVEETPRGAKSGDVDEVVTATDRTLRDLQSQLSAFKKESAESMKLAEGKVAELEKKLAITGTSKSSSGMGPPIIPPPEPLAEEARVREVAALKAKLAALESPAGPTDDGASGSLRDMLAGIFGDDRELLDKVGDERKASTDKETLRRKMCMSLSYQLSELKKDKLGVRPEDAQTIPQLWDSIRYRVTQESEFSEAIRSRMGELTQELQTAQEEAVNQLSIVTGPLRHHPPEYKAQIEALFVAKLHRKLREHATVTEAPIFSLSSDAAKECESSVQSKAKVPVAKQGAAEAVEQDRGRDRHDPHWRGGGKFGNNRGGGKYGGQYAYAHRRDGLPYDWVEDRTCHICHVRGHIATNCPNRQGQWHGRWPPYQQQPLQQYAAQPPPPQQQFAMQPPAPGTERMGAARGGAKGYGPF